MTDTLSVTVPIERKQPDIPRYVVIPTVLIEPWDLLGTTVIEGTLNGVSIGRRTIKHWDDKRWFIEIPESLCRQAKVDTGDTISLEIRRASTELPEELSALLADNVAAKAMWDRLSKSRQRMFSEHVGSAKNPQTRIRRAAQLNAW